MLLFDCEDFQVISRTGSASFLLITFSSLGMFGPSGSLADGKVFWGKALADKFNYNTLGFVSKKRSWFCSNHMDAARQALSYRIAEFSTVITYGSSMGGYAALRWAKSLSAHAAIAFAPQFSIDPQEVGQFDTRYRYAFLPELHTGMSLKDEQVGCPSYVLFDPYLAQDRKHVDLIRQNITSLHELHLSFCGHECIRAFSSSESIDQLIQIVIASDFDAARRLTGALRRLATIRAVELVERLTSVKPHTASKLYQHYSPLFEVAQKKRLAAQLMAKGFLSEAASQCS